MMAPRPENLLGVLKKITLQMRKDDRSVCRLEMALRPGSLSGVLEKITLQMRRDDRSVCQSLNPGTPSGNNSGTFKKSTFQGGRLRSSNPRVHVRMRYICRTKGRKLPTGDLPTENRNNRFRAGNNSGAFKKVTLFRERRSRRRTRGYMYACGSSAERADENYRRDLPTGKLRRTESRTRFIQWKLALQTVVS